MIDLQNDFFSGGSLPVPEAEAIIPPINRLQREFEIVIASKDWHPKGHISFASSHNKKVGDRIQLPYGEQVLWPDHCIKYSEGSDFLSSLEKDRITHIVYKGSDPKVDSYSVFFDQNKVHSTDLYFYLQNHNINHLYVVGVVVEYCIKASVLDALSLGFKVTLIKEGCKELDVEMSKKALAEMQGPNFELIL